MHSDQVTQEQYEMIYIKQNDVVIVHISPFTISILTSEQAKKFGFDISKMKEYEKISINYDSSDGYELTQRYDEYVEPEFSCP
ncbi:hypothetical protein PU00_08170 [Hafnia alvei]|uniref:hypothetical protein n=1 Tax=Hafnia alvei TaxID=569 RepID=UPI0005828075|nr:hypothetical protein [Hafnia alvei]KID03943.1 hypothetical protein PU00_08170 [Hafnia alvei]